MHTHILSDERTHLWPGTHKNLNLLLCLLKFANPLREKLTHSMSDLRIDTHKVTYTHADTISVKTTLQ